MSYTSGEMRNEPGKAIKILPKEANIELTARQQLFCEKYIENGFKSAGQACIDAGYAGKHPYVAANTLLKNTKVRQYIQIRKKQLLKEAGVNTYNILIELASIAFSDIRQLYNADGTLKNVTDLDKHVAAALESVETDEIIDTRTGALLGYTKKAKLNSKLKALELLMRFKGLLDKDKDKGTINFNNFEVTLDLGDGVPKLKLSNGQAEQEQ